MSATGDFYRAFEDRHRGTTSGIEERQRAYLPFLSALKDAQAPAGMIDLGCGRGEWLSLAKSQGWQVRGVDMDAAMLDAARAAGLDVQQADAVQFLRACSAASTSAITAFHVVEHLSFDDMRALLTEAERVLAPGGLLLLETPNPENLVVGSSAFHMDPTHVRPLPPALLAFAVEFAGFAPVATLRLHEGVDESRSVELIDVLAGVSPDYAVVARKPGGVASDALDALFAAQRGVTLNALADRYDAQMREVRVNAELGREAGLRFAIAQQKLVARLEALESGAAALQEAGVPPGSLRERVEAMMQRADVLQYEVAAMRASTSWRVTQPLRSFGEWRIRFANGVHASLERHPGVHALARGVARALRIVPRRDAPAPGAPPAAPAAGDAAGPPPTDGLTPEARAVHGALVQAATGSREQKEV